MEHLKLEIEGMSCDHCVNRVQKALARLDGVSLDGVQVGSADLRYDALRVSPERIVEAVDDAGYTARPAGGAA
jgi:copper chaperone